MIFLGVKFKISLLITPRFERKERRELRGMVERGKGGRMRRGNREIMFLHDGEEREREKCGWVCGGEKMGKKEGGEFMEEEREIVG